MKKNYVRILSTLLSLAILLSISAPYVSAQNITTESHTLLTWSRDGGVVSEQYTTNLSNTRSQRIKEAYRPNHLLSEPLDEPTRGLASSQRRVNGRISPYCTIGLLAIYFDLDEDGSLETEIAQNRMPVYGTAFLEAEDIILTAAHCLYRRDLDMFAQKVVFYPGKSGPNDTYFDAFTSEVIEMYIPQDYVNGDNHTDWAICQLEDNLGDSLGWLGLSGSPTVGLDLTLSGYPEDTSYTVQKWQYKTLGEITQIVNNKFFKASNYSYKGHSGGPLFDANGTVFGICSIGMYTSNDGLQEADTGAAAFPPWAFDLIVDKCDESAARWN